MTRTLHGRLHGRTIELDEDLGGVEGQVVEVQITISMPSSPPDMTRPVGLARIYELLGERYDSGLTDVAERHNEHQP
jgi:hypothetical protein